MRWLVSALCREDHSNYSVYYLPCWKLHWNQKLDVLVSIYRLCSSCGCSIHESWRFPASASLQAFRNPTSKCVFQCSSLDWAMEESPAACSMIQFTTQFSSSCSNEIGFLLSDLSVFPFVQWIALLCVHSCGEGPYLIQPQISCWPALQLDEQVWNQIWTLCESSSSPNWCLC